MPASPHARPVFCLMYGYDLKASTWSVTPANTAPAPPFEVSTLSLITWNIDFSAPLPILRLKTLLSHLEQLLSLPLNTQRPPTAIILLQEFHKTCFDTLLSHPFVRALYNVTDISPASWPSGSNYGTVTLIPKFLAVSSVFRTVFPNSVMGRDALYVDVRLPPHATAESPNITIRIANTHLESLPGHGDRARPAQLKTIAQFLSSPGIYGGIVGGDMNAVSPSDFDLPDRVGLSDPWGLTKVASQEQEEIERTRHTWGHQPPSRFQARRLDKILTGGNVKIVEMRKIGVGLKFSAGSGGDSEDQEAWVSDHCGLLATITTV